MKQYKVKLGRVSVRPGMVVETDDKVWARRYAARLEPVDESVDEDKSDSLPEDFPGVGHLAKAGITTFEGLKGVKTEELEEINGIGKVTAEAIIEASET